MAEYLKHVLWFVLTLATVYRCMAIEYVVSNNAESSIGGKLFDQQVGAEYAKQALSSAADFTLKLFEHNIVVEGKIIQEVIMIVENIDGVAYDSKKEITGILYHEMTHILQWDGNGQAPSGLIEGIADSCYAFTLLF